MTLQHPVHEQTALRAESAWSRLPDGGRESIVLRIHCGHSHHVAEVYRTDEGLVYRAPVRARSHGTYDLPDEPHKDQKPHVWFDLLDVDGADDALPAWCSCGPRSLSRRAVREWVAEGDHRVIVD